MKATTTMMTFAVLFLAGSTLLGGQFNLKKWHVPQYRPHYTQPRHQPYVPPHDPGPPADFEPIDEEPFDEEPIEGEFLGNGIEYEVKVQHPLTFAWQTVKTFEDEGLAEEYAAQIEGRHWVVYTGRGGSAAKFSEAFSLADARSKVNALRQAGAVVKAIEPFQVQVMEESLEAIFDNALHNVAAAPEESKVPNELAPLLGLWEAATQDAEGNVTRILLNLNADGSAEMTVPTATGGKVTLQRDFAIDAEGMFKLTGGSSELVLGSVVEAGAEKVVLDRGGAKITFLRP